MPTIQFGDWDSSLSALESYYGGADAFKNIITGADGKYDPALFKKAIEGVPGFKAYHGPDGKVNWYTYDETVRGTALGSVNSNVNGGSYAAGANFQVPASIKTAQDGKLVVSSGIGYAKSTGITVQGVLGTVAEATLATMTGIALGKVVSNAIYKTGQYFGKDLWQYNPEVWNSITIGNNDVSSNLFNVAFRLSADNKSLTPYIDEKAFAYIAAYMNDTGAFDTVETATPEDKTGLDNYSGGVPISSVATDLVTTGDYAGSYDKFYNLPGDAVFFRSTSDIHPVIASRTSQYIRIKVESKSVYRGEVISTYTSEIGTKKFTTNNVQNKRAYGYSFSYGGRNGNAHTPVPYGPATIDGKGTYADACWSAVYGAISEKPRYEGLQDQYGAKLPNLTKDMSIPDVLLALQDQYPEIWDQAIENTEFDKDGNPVTKNLIPVPWPNGDNYSIGQPTSGDRTQGQTQTNPENSIESVIKNLLDTITKINNKLDVPDTGKGDTPENPLPVGKASSLWAIYNPTQAEVDAFGSWMWSSNLVEQIKKLFNDPMQAVIGIHKVYAPPIIEGTRTIKVGYLDSGVSSNYVGAQYSEVDCGKVQLDEYFGNVFDYAPYTQVSMYLPFVGVVQLDVADVMRSTIGVSYGVDVLTGDCLAKVSVERDGAGGIIYSFPGNCAVKYPISSGSYMSIVGYGMGAAATIATGNIGMFGAVSGVFGHRPTVQHSGAFVGNSGATGPKIPYLIISRPQSALAKGFPMIEGYPTNYTTLIGECKGFIVVKDVHVEGINATDDELSMIEELLKNGVIIS